MLDPNSDLARKIEAERRRTQEVRVQAGLVGLVAFFAALWLLVKEFNPTDFPGYAGVGIGALAISCIIAGAIQTRAFR